MKVIILEGSEMIQLVIFFLDKANASNNTKLFDLRVVSLYFISPNALHHHHHVRLV